MLKTVGRILLAFGACALMLAVIGQVPVHAGVGVSLMCSGLAWMLLPWWARKEVLAVSAPADVPEPVVLREVIAPAKKGSVAPFMAERLTRSEGAQVATIELFESYHAWCRANGFVTLDAASFTERLETICETANIRRGTGQSLINVALAE